jgi:predicted DNA-binding protein (MmcQ/YjbR family)
VLGVSGAGLGAVGEPGGTLAYLPGQTTPGQDAIHAIYEEMVSIAPGFEREQPLATVTNADLALTATHRRDGTGIRVHVVATAEWLCTIDLPRTTPTAAVTGAELRQLCLSLPGAREEFPFRPGLSVFKVSARMFALSALDEQPLRVSVKCNPDLGEQLRNTYPSITPGYHLNKRHWLTLIADGSIPDDLVADLIHASYELVAAPRSPRR